MKRQHQVLLVGGAVMAVLILSNRVTTRKRAAAAPAPTPDTSGPIIPIYAPAPPAAPAPAPVKTARARLIDVTEQAIYKEVPARRLSPLATRTLAVNLVSMCADQNYPLDLAFGHVLAESDCQLLAQNSSSGAVGPLQVTSIAAKQVGVPWPIQAPPTQLEAGLKYMKWLRSAYPECAASVRVTLQHYGMGRGNWLKYRAQGCGPTACSSPISVIRAECGCNPRHGISGYSNLVITMARRHPELHTTSWWGS